MEKEKYIKNLNELLEVQMENIKKYPNESEYTYNTGLYNGMEIARALFLGIQPEFFDGTKIRRVNNEN